MLFLTVSNYLGPTANQSGPNMPNFNPSTPRPPPKDPPSIKCADPPKIDGTKWEENQLQDLFATNVMLSLTCFFLTKIFKDVNVKQSYSF